MNLKSLFKFSWHDLLKLDWVLILSILTIIAFGTYNIYISTSPRNGLHYTKMQLAFTVIGFLVMFLVAALDYRKVIGLIPYYYWFVNVLLVGVLFTSSIGGATGWFKVGPISIQPAELAKVSILLMTAKNMQDCDGRINVPVNFFKATAYALLPMGLMMLQPEMGLTMVSFFIVLFIYFICGLRLWVIGGGFAALIAAIVFALSTNLVPPHWRARIVAFLSLKQQGGDVDTFQLDQGMIAIGSGELKGAENPGYYNWIPEFHTDFIFAVISENFGFIGSVGLILLFMIVLWRVLMISLRGKDAFTRSIGAGMFGLLLFSIMQNIGMTIGIMPISGITLPFVSYGGSSMVTNMIAIGICLAVARRYKKRGTTMSFGRF